MGKEFNRRSTSKVLVYLLVVVVAAYHPYTTSLTGEAFTSRRRLFRGVIYIPPQDSSNIKQWNSNADQSGDAVDFVADALTANVNNGVGDGAEVISESGDVTSFQKFHEATSLRASQMPSSPASLSSPSSPASLKTAAGQSHNDPRPVPFFATPVDNSNATRIVSAQKMSRREVFRRGALSLLGVVLVTESILEVLDILETGESRGIVAVTNVAKHLAPTDLSPVNLTQVARETNINVTLSCDSGCVSVSKNFTKIQTKKVPKWYPTFLIPPPKVIKEISNGELLAAATVAGATTSFARDALLYPLQTIKTRIQTDKHNYSAKPLKLQDRFANLGQNVRRHFQEGDLYAGLTPTLLISGPATGVYFGIRDVTKRVLSMMPFLNDVEIVLIAAFCADVVSLSVRTPADALAVRLQDQSGDVGDWLGDSLRRLPGIIITDLPYLLSKIFLGRQFIRGTLTIDQYAYYAIISAVVAAFLTTPFDVARTRILIDSDGDPSNGIDGGSGEGVIKTMIAISKEGRGGVSNLFAGWLERVLYLGIGRAWLEPLQLIAYIGIRDTILLEWF